MLLRTMLVLWFTVATTAADTLHLPWKRVGLPSSEQVKGIEACPGGTMLVTGVDAYTIRDSMLLPVLEGLPHRSVTDVLYRGSVMDVATSTGGIFRSSDHGLRWEHRPLPGKEQNVVRLASIAASDYALLASGTLFTRVRKDAPWSPVRVPDSVPAVRDILADGPLLFAVTDSGGVYAVHARKGWSQTIRFPGMSGRALVAASKGVLIAAVDSVLYQIQQGSKKTLRKICDIPTDKWLSMSIASGSVVLVGKGRRMVRVDVATGALQDLPVPGATDDRIGSIYWNGTTLLAGIDRGNGGLYTMRIDTPIWQSVSLSTTKNADIMVNRIVERNGTVIVCMLRNGLYVLDTALRRAEQRHQGIRGTALATLHALSKDRYVTSRRAGVFRLTGCGSTVERASSGIPVGEGFAAAAMQNELFVTSGRRGLWRTTSGGRKWIPCRYPDSSAYVDRLDVLGSSLIASARDRSWISQNRGASWTRLRILSDTSMLRWTASNGAVHLVGTTTGSYIKRGASAVWERITTPYSQETDHRFGNASISGNTVLLGTKGAVLLSQDAGVTWKPIDISPATFASYVALVGSAINVVTDRGDLLIAPLP